MEKCNNWMFFARHSDKKQTRRQNMAEIVFSWVVSEIKYIIFIENNDYPYENCNHYIKLSRVFHPMIIFLGNKEFHFCQAY
jgi:retron-type reverse transcriptase